MFFCHICTCHGKLQYILHISSDFLRYSVIRYDLDFTFCSFAVFHFPLPLLSDGGSSSAKLDSEMMMINVCGETQSPLSGGSSGMDSGTDSLPDHFSDLPHVAVSLCGGLTDNIEITRGTSNNI